jgi:hypothetical protein
MASSPSIHCFFKPSVTVSTMRGSRMALKISSTSASSPSIHCFFKPSVTVSTMRGSRMALKISSSPSM